MTLQINYTICDLPISGSSAYDSVRGLSYNEADVFLVCYKVSDPSTLYNVKHKWIPEIKRQRSDVPVILCGCQNDLRRDPEVISNLAKRGRAPVTQDQALAVCCDIGASNYVDTSSLMTTDVVETFEVAAIAAMRHVSKYNTSSSHSSVNSKRFNTTSSKNSSVRLNVSFEGGAAEISSGQVAQPQTMPPYDESAEDLFPPSSPVQRRSIVPQRSSFSGPRPANLPTSPNNGGGALIKSNGLSRRTSFRSPTSVNNGGNGESKNVPIPKVDVVLRQEPKEKTKAYESLKSHGSTGSTGSKTSTGSSSVMLELDEENVPNTEDPELLGQLNFVSPKAGVYRPVSTPSQNKYKDKEKCSIM